MATKVKHVQKESVLGSTLEEMIAAMPPEIQARIAEQSAILHAEVQGLKALRKLASRSQEQIAQSLGVKQSYTYRPCAASSRPQAEHLSYGLNFPEAVLCG